MKRIITVLLVVAICGSCYIAVFGEDSDIGIRQAIFDDVYVPLATREISLILESVKTFLSNTGYHVIHDTVGDDPDSEFLSISVYAAKSCEEDDYSIFISLLPLSNGLIAPMTMSYYWKDKNIEVGWNNFSTEHEARYDTFNTHVVGEREQKVSGIEEQRLFLFGQRTE